MARRKPVFLRRRDVENCTGLSRSTIYKKMGEGTFPRPAAQVGTRGVRWLEREITAWMQSCLRAQRVKANQEKQRPKPKPETEAEAKAEAEAEAKAEIEAEAEAKAEAEIEAEVETGPGLRTGPKSPPNNMTESARPVRRPSTS